MNRFFLALICVIVTLSSSFGQQPAAASTTSPGQQHTSLAQPQTATSTTSSGQQHTSPAQPQTAASTTSSVQQHTSPARPQTAASTTSSGQQHTSLAQPQTSAPTASSGQQRTSLAQPKTAASGAPLRRHTFTTNDTAFLLDGKPFQIISGEMHYPRIPRAAWRQRMRMAKAMGINTIGTYVFWNVQEPEKGIFDFSGNNDIAAFVRIAQEEGLWVLLRPSPYVCAEWEFGGYPYWLQNIPGLVVRSKEPQYLREYQRYIQRLGKELSPLLVTNGGNILMVQVENEYGAYASDKEYLEINRKMFVKAGFNCLLNTCDPAKDIAKGTITGFLPAINGDNSPEKVKEIIDDIHNGKGPYFMAEWYPAWFDWWGEPHHTVPAEKYARQLDSVLSAGISINMYMFHGGTTRGFMNGANCYDTSFYQPQVSSYDYDAPLDEAGNATEKFMVFRSVIARHLPPGRHLPDVPPSKPAITLPPIVFTQQTALVDMLPVPRVSPRPLTFEELHQAYGYVLYRTNIPAAAALTSTQAASTPASPGSVHPASYAPAGPATSATPAEAANQAAFGATTATALAGPATTAVLRIDSVRDYAIVFVNGKRQGILDRMKKQDSLLITVPAEGATLDILVENMGRINYGPNLLKNKKGITQMVSFNNQELKGWKMYSFPFDHVDTQRSVASNRPALPVTTPRAPASPTTTSQTPIAMTRPTTAATAGNQRTEATATVTAGNQRTEATAAATATEATTTASDQRTEAAATSTAANQSTATQSPRTGFPANETPTLKKATFHLDAVGDTYLDMRPWGKGCVWINGHNLGRYWEIGPQQTIYVPAEWLRKGDNVVEVLELIKPEQNELKSLAKPILDQLHHA